jgi:hypothetical protein
MSASWAFVLGVLMGQGSILALVWGTTRGRTKR